MLERQVIKIWETDRDELSRGISALYERANRKEAEAVGGLSLDEAAATIVRSRDQAVIYFDLFDVLKHGQAAKMNIVQFYHALRRSPKVRMNGIGCILR